MVLAAVKQNGLALAWTPENEKDLDVVLAAPQQGVAVRGRPEEEPTRRARRT